MSILSARYVRDAISDLIDNHHSSEQSLKDLKCVERMGRSYIKLTFNTGLQTMIYISEVSTEQTVTGGERVILEHFKRMSKEEQRIYLESLAPTKEE